MPGPNIAFEKLLGELKDENVQFLAGKPWTDRLYVRNFSAFFHRLADILQLVDDAANASNRYVNEETGENCRQFECNQIKRLHDFLHDMARNNVRYLSQGLPGANDEYEDCPLVVIYDGVATCVQFMRQFFPIDDCYYKRPMDVPYCIQHELTTGADVEIRAFTLQHLLCALTHIEQSAHVLTYNEELLSYVDALETRVADFLLFAMSEVAHNAEGYRVPYADGLYTCNTATEYQLVVLILAVRQLMESAAPLWRDPESYMPDTADDEVLVGAVRAKFIVEIQSVHSDIVEENFYKRYTQESISNSEGYLFFKANPLSSRIEPGVIIRQFRNVPQWRRITETAARPVADFLFEPENDFLGFKIAFALAADLIFSQTLRISWFEVYTDGDRIRCMNSSDYQVFVEESYKIPLVVVLLNDACVMFRGRLSVFGRRHTDYYRALVHWLAIVQHEMSGFYRPHRPVAPLVDALFKEQLAEPRRRAVSTETAGFTRRDFAVRDDDQSLCLDPEYILSELNAEQRPYRPPPIHGVISSVTPMSAFVRMCRAKADYEHVVARIDSKPQEIDANSIIGDTDETGFPMTARSAWV